MTVTSRSGGHRNKQHVPLHFFSTNVDSRVGDKISFIWFFWAAL